MLLKDDGKCDNPSHVCGAEGDNVKWTGMKIPERWKSKAPARWQTTPIRDDSLPRRRAPSVAIRNYAQRQTVDYRTTITFTAEVTNPVSGAAVYWFTNGQDKGATVTYSEKETRASCTVQAKYIQDGTVLAESETETVNVKTGFFTKLKAFLRALFGRLPKVAQE